MKNNGLSKRNIVIGVGIIIILMVIGSFCDYRLSQSVFNHNSLFGQIGAAYGQVPASLGINIAGMLMLYIMPKEFKLENLLAYFVGFVFLIGGAVVCFVEPTKYLKLPHLVLHMITALLLIIANIGILRLVRNTNKAKIKQFIKFTLFVVIGTMLIVNILKITWERPRMRFLSQINYMALGANFQPWWKIGSNSKEFFMELGVASDEFKSFPSGHTACAACMLLLTALPYLNKSFQNRGNVLLGVAIFFTLLVGFSRIIMGAHFLTDVTMGFSVTFFLVLIAHRIFLNEKMNSVK